MSSPLKVLVAMRPHTKAKSDENDHDDFLVPWKVFLRDQRRHSSEIGHDLVLPDSAHQQVCLWWSQFVFARQPLNHI